MSDKQVELSREIQMKEEKLSDVTREQDSFTEALFTFFQSMRKSQQQLAENQNSDPSTNDYENMKQFENDQSFFQGISTRISSLEEEITDEYRLKKSELVDEIEKLQATKATNITKESEEKDGQ